MLLVDERNPRARALYEAIRPHLDESALPDNLYLVFGGDGHLLAQMHQHGAGPIYFGLNAGYLGFLLNDVNDPRAMAAAIMEGRWKAWNFPRLEMLATCADGSEILDRAVNDIYVERMTGQTARLQVTIDGVLAVEKMVCDGLATATSLGSTAYSFSAGGVPCHPMVRGFHVTPICPHAPRLSPFMLPETSSVELEILQAERRPVRAVCDGVDHGEVVRLQVRQANDNIHLAYVEGHHFTRTMMRKVLKS